MIDTAILVIQIKIFNEQLTTKQEYIKMHLLLVKQWLVTIHKKFRCSFWNLDIHERTSGCTIIESEGT